MSEEVETLTNQDGDLIGYSCQKILASNVAEPMDIKFYMDLLTPKANSKNNGNALTPQENAIQAAQEILLREMSRQYGIDPDVSKGVRCFDLPVDGSTWIVQMTIDPRFFVEEPLFGKESNAIQYNTLWTIGTTAQDVEEQNQSMHY